MRVTEQLVRNNQKKEQKKKRPPAEEEEETLTYMPYPVEKYAMNGQPGVFTRKDDSFHTQESVFDRTAVFRTGAGSETGQR